MAAAALLAAGSVQAQVGGTAEKSSLERGADSLMVGLPVAALGLTFLVDKVADGAVGNSLLGFDFVHMTGEPRHDLGLALLRTEVVSYGLKAAVDDPRPNGEDGGFPSSHTSLTFSSAEFIRKEYGWRWGAPAYALAGFVGWSRVETGDHYWEQVLAGAAIGIASNHDFSELTTRWGSLNLRPSLLSTHSAEFQAGARDTAAPGLRFELRF